MGHEVFLTENGEGCHLKILVQKGGPVIYHSGEKFNLTCNDYCYHREVVLIVVLPVCCFAVSSPSEIRH